jgi:hypothetical protein
MIIGVNGYAGSGKDTIGKMIQYIFSKETEIKIDVVTTNYKLHEWWLEEKSGWEIKKFAGKLKQIGSILTGIPAEKFEDQEFKKALLGPEWGTLEDNPLNNIPVFEDVKFNSLMSVRDFLQKLGTDGLRNGLHSNVWVNALMADYSCVPADRAPNGWDCDNWVVTDTRFPNEAIAIKQKGGIVIRVDRPGVKPVNPHPSEVALDDWNFDYKIMNISDLISLKQTVEQVLKQAKLL